MKQWFDENKDEAHRILVDTATSLLNENESVNEDFRRYASLYKDRHMIGFDCGEWRRSATDYLEPPVTYNVIRSCVDTLGAKVTSHHPSPRFLTSGGDTTLQQKARGMEKFACGIFYQEKVYQKASRAFRDACLYGVGCLKIFPDATKVKVDVVHPTHIIVDNNATLHSDQLSTIYQREFISKNKLKTVFSTPKKKAIIEGAETKSINSPYGFVRDLVEVWEGWSLPQGKNDDGTWIKPGRHIICTSAGTLIDEQWNEGSFPFVFIRLYDDLLGWYGIGLGEQLEGIQVEINETLSKLQLNQRFLAVPYILKHKTSKIPDEHFVNNEEAKVIEWEGNVAPSVVTPPAAHPQTYDYLETLYNRAFELSGISQLSATAAKPSGLNSGVALRTYSDIETQRFSVISKQWEEMFVELSKLIINCAKKISEVEPMVSKHITGQNLEMVNWTDVELDDEQYVLQVYPASSLPKSPAGRLERVTELVNAGMVSAEEARNLLDFPDLEKSNRLATAAFEDLEMSFEHMLAGKSFIEPLVYQDLQTGIKLCTSYYLRAKIDGAEQSNLDKLARWVDEAVALLTGPQPFEEVPPQPLVGMEPGAAPPPQGPFMSADVAAAAGAPIPQ